MCHIEFNFFRSKINYKHGVKTLQAVKALAFSIGMDIVLLKGLLIFFLMTWSKKACHFPQNRVQMYGGNWL